MDLNDELSKRLSLPKSWEGEDRVSLGEAWSVEIVINIIKKYLNRILN